MESWQKTQEAEAMNPLTEMKAAARRAECHIDNMEEHRGRIIAEFDSFNTCIDNVLEALKALANPEFQRGWREAERFYNRIDSEHSTQMEEQANG